MNNFAIIKKIKNNKKIKKRKRAYYWEMLGRNGKMIFSNFQKI
jgi:hypothetical protein